MVICNTSTELGHQKNGVVSSHVTEANVVELSPVSCLLVKHWFSSASPEIVSRLDDCTGKAVAVDGRHCLCKNKTHAEHKSGKLLQKLTAKVGERVSGKLPATAVII